MIIKKWDGTASQWLNDAPKTTLGSLFTDTTFSTSVFDGNSKIKQEYLPDAAFGNMRQVGTITSNTTTDALTTLINTYVTNNGGTVDGCYFISNGTYTITLSAGDSWSGGEEGDTNGVVEVSDWVIYNSADSWSIINNTYQSASSSAFGVVKLGSDTAQGVNANAVSSTASRTYAIQNDSSNRLVVNIPWTDHTYTGGTYVTLDGSTFNHDSTSRSDSSNSVDPQADGTFTVVDSVTTNATGHVTGINVKTVSMPDAHPTQTAISIDTAGAEVMDTLTVNTLGHVTAATKRTMTLADLGYTGAADANKYVHPTYDGDDINLDTGALTGATVISDLDFNVTTDTSGHVTDANATYSTRTLTLADLGYTAPTIGNGAFSIATSTGISGGGALGTANQTGNTSLTLTIDYPVYYGETLPTLTASDDGAIGFLYE